MKWKCKDGKGIKVKDMETSHLKHTINYLNRKADSLRLNMLKTCEEAEGFLRGEMSLALVEQEITSIENTTDEELVEETFPIIIEMKEELDKR